MAPPSAGESDSDGSGEETHSDGQRRGAAGGGTTAAAADGSGVEKAESAVWEPVTDFWGGAGDDDEMVATPAKCDTVDTAEVEEVKSAEKEEEKGEVTPVDEGEKEGSSERQESDGDSQSVGQPGRRGSTGKTEPKLCKKGREQVKLSSKKSTSGSRLDTPMVTVQPAVDDSKRTHTGDSDAESDTGNSASQGKTDENPPARPPPPPPPPPDTDASGQIKPKKTLGRAPAGFMGELMSQLKKSKTEGDVLVGKKKVRKHHRVEVDDAGKPRMRKLRRRLPKLHCEHAFCDKLMTRLHSVVMEREAGGNPVELRLSQVAEQLHTVIAEHIDGTVERMLDTAEAECPHVLVAPVRQTLRAAGAERLRLALTSDQVGAGLQRAGAELADRVNELHLAVAAQVSDRIVDEVIESLTRSYQELTGDATRKRACTPDVLKSHPRLSGGADSGSAEPGRSREDVTSEPSSDLSPPATPQLHAKKMNLQGRKTRPKSVVEIDTVSELPASAHQLRHLGKARPRRAKSRAPTRPVVGDEAGGLDSGLDVFFPPARSLPSSPLTSPDSESRQLMTTSADNTPHLGLDRARRSSALRDEEAQRDKKSANSGGGGGGVKKGISSVFSKLAADRVARSREDRDGDSTKAGRKAADPADSDSSAGSGSADSFLNHLLSPVVVPPPAEEASSSEPALRRPAGLAGTDLLAEIRAKQEKRASLTPKHTPEELEERSPLQEVKGRAAALAAALRSPSPGHHGPPSISPKPSLASKPKQASPLPGQGKPPPLGPKPRPKSMAARTENRHSGGASVSGDAEEGGVVSPPAADSGPDSWSARPAADSAAAGAAAAADSTADGTTGSPSAQRPPKRLTAAELESLLESSVDGPPPPAAVTRADPADPAAPPVPNLVLDQSFSLDDVINV